MKPAKIDFDRDHPPATLDDFCGSWLVHRSDAMMVKKGSRLIIRPDGEEARFDLYESVLDGEPKLANQQARFENGKLLFTSLAGNPEQQWLCQASLFFVEEDFGGGEPPGTRKFLSCIDIYGDPENAGVWGAEQDGSATGGGPVTSRTS